MSNMGVHSTSPLTMKSLISVNFCVPGKKLRPEIALLTLTRLIALLMQFSGNFTVLKRSDNSWYFSAIFYEIKLII